MIEVMVAMTLLSIVMMSLAKISVSIATRGRTNDLNAKRNAALQVESNKLGTLAFTGGATRSAFWSQLRADVLGRPVHIPRHADSAVGMAILAASGSASVAQTADRMVTIDRVVEPRPGCTERYLPIFRRMVDELERRAYIDANLAAAARLA